jgi:hypothetical protein
VIGTVGRRRAHDRTIAITEEGRRALREAGL